MENYRFYSFTNMYLSSMQKGIQTAHAVSEMSVDYQCYSGDPSPGFLIYNVWAESDKTINVLDGGNQATLNKLYTDLTSVIDIYNFQYPVVKFHEDEQSLNGALTCVGIILPEDVYRWNSEMLVDETGDSYHPYENKLPLGTFAIQKLIHRYRLAV